VTSGHLAEASTAIVAVSVATAEVILPDTAAWTERLGTVGILVFAGVLAMRWLVAQLERKDAHIERVTVAAEAAARANQDVLLKALREGYEVQRQIVQSQNELASAIRQGRDHA